MIKTQSPHYDRFLADAAKRPLLTGEEEQHLAHLNRAGYSSAVEVLVLHNILFAAKVSNKFYRNDDDALSVAIEGMWRGAEKFQPGHGKFISYAVFWIISALQKYDSREGRTVQIPIAVGQAVRHLNKFQARGGNPVTASPQEIRDDLGIKNDSQSGADSALRNAAALMYPTMSLNMQINDDQGSMEDEYGDFIPDGRQNPEDVYATSKITEGVQMAMECLTDREKKILHMRYLDEGNAAHRIQKKTHMRFRGETATYDEIGAVFGLTRERIRQICNESFRKMLKKHGPLLADLMAGVQ